MAVHVQDCNLFNVAIFRRVPEIVDDQNCDENVEYRRQQEQHLSHETLRHKAR
jgi:hypothetical protein